MNKKIDILDTSFIKCVHTYITSTKGYVTVWSLVEYTVSKPALGDMHACWGNDSSGFVVQNRFYW